MPACCNMLCSNRDRIALESQLEYWLKGMTDVVLYGFYAGIKAEK